MALLKPSLSFSILTASISRLGLIFRVGLISGETRQKGDFSCNYFQNRIHQSGVQLEVGTLFFNPSFIVAFKQRWCSNRGFTVPKKNLFKITFNCSEVGIHQNLTCISKLYIQLTRTNKQLILGKCKVCNKIK